MPLESPDPIDVQVGLQLRSLRKAQKISQAELGTALGITFQQVQKYERGNNRISASMLVKAAKLMGVPASALLPEEGDTMVVDLNQRFSSVRGVDALVLAYGAIKASKYRRALLQVARILCSDTVYTEPQA